MPWYLNDDGNGNGNDGKRSERETSKKRGTTLLRRISSRYDDALDEKREKEKKGTKNVGEEEVAAGNEKKKKKWKNKFKRKRRRGKEDEEEKEDDDDEKEEKNAKLSGAGKLASFDVSVFLNPDAFKKLVRKFCSYLSPPSDEQQRQPVLDDSNDGAAQLSAWKAFMKVASDTLAPKNLIDPRFFSVRCRS